MDNFSHLTSRYVFSDSVRSRRRCCPFANHLFAFRLFNSFRVQISLSSETSPNALRLMTSPLSMRNAWKKQHVRCLVCGTHAAKRACLDASCISFVASISLLYCSQSTTHRRRMKGWDGHRRGATRQKRQTRRTSMSQTRHRCRSPRDVLTSHRPRHHYIRLSRWARNILWQRQRKNSPRPYRV